MIDSLLDTLCTQLGFCLPSEARAQLAANPPQGVEAFAEGVWRLEGMGDIREPRFQELCAVIAAFPRVGSLRVEWDEDVVATVVVDEDFRLSRRHVTGQFIPGSSFGALREDLVEMSRLRAAGDEEGAGELSHLLDARGLIAVDLVGRRFVVTGARFEEGGLLFAIDPDPER